MSYYQSQSVPTPGAGGGPVPPGLPLPPAVPRKAPGTLTAAVWLGVVSGLLTILGGVMDIVSGKDSINKALSKAAGALGVDPDLVQQVAGDELNKAYHTLVIKAAVAIVVGVAILAVALAARNAAMWARITLTVVLVVGMCAGSGLQLGDRSVLPSVSVIAAALTPLLSIAAIVLLFLPATNRYASARKGF